MHSIALFLLISTSALAHPVSSEAEAIRLGTDAIHKFGLTKLKDECGIIDVNDKRSYFELVVRETHREGCGGSGETGPRLFSIRVRKRDGRLTSDVYDGTSYRPLDRPARHTK